MEEEIIIYVTQADLEAALSPATVLALFDDQGTGEVNQVALLAILKRASDMVDSYLSRVYRGPFPVVQVPVPSQIKNVALEFAIAFSFERHPEYVHTYGESYRAGSRFTRAVEMMDRFAQGQQEIPDWRISPRPGNIGGIITSDGPRTIIDSVDGTYNGGDF